MALQTRAQVDATIAADFANNTTGDISAQDLREGLTDIADSALFVGDAEIRVIDMTSTAPPGSPGDRDAYVVAATATGAWAGEEDSIAVYDLGATAWVFIAPTDGAAVWNLDDDAQYRWDAAASPPAWVDQTVAGSDATQSLIVAVSDETTALTTGTGKITFRMPYAFTLSAVRASVTTAPTGAAITVDINENASSILSTKLTIDATEKTSTTAATPAVISDSALADDAEITIDIDTVGSTIAGAGLKVTLIGVKA